MRQLILNYDFNKSIRDLFTKTRNFIGTLLLVLLVFNTSGQTLTVNSGSTVTITTDTYYASVVVKNGGTLIINSPATLTIGAAGTPATTQVVDFQNGSVVLINSGSTLVVNGLLNNSNSSTGITFNGIVQVNGNVTAGNGSTIVGSGTLNSTGTIISQSSGTIFGSTGDCNTGPCDGNNLTTSTWTGTTNTSWSLGTNWSSGNIPTLTDNIYIPSSVASGRMPVISTVANVKYISNNGTLTFTTSSTLNVYGNMYNTGIVNTVTGSTLIFKGTIAQTITGIPILYNLQIANTSGVSIMSAVTLKGALTLSSGILTTNSNLTINFDNGGHIAYHTADTGSISGNVSGRRDVIARTHYIAAPFSGVTSTQVDVTTPLFYNGYWKMYTKTFDTQGWAAVTNASTSMPLGTGFSLSMPAAAPLILTGTYSHNSSFITPLYSNASATKYILVGNPYPSTLDWTAAPGWTKTNIADAIYYWNASTSSVSSYIAGVSSNSGTQYIPAMQSFMVTTTGTGGSSSVLLNNNARINLQNPSFMRNGTPDETIRLKLSNNNPNQWDDAVIRFNVNATNEFDFNWDAYKIVSRGATPQIYTTLGNTNYSINSVAVVDSLPNVNIMTYIPKDGTYKLSIVNSDPTTEYILVDTKMGTEHNLLDSNYVFIGYTTDVNRFQLKLSPKLRNYIVTGITSSNRVDDINISSTTKGFVIQSKQYIGYIASIEIMDMTGKHISIISGESLSEVQYIPLDLAEGSYIVKVSVDNKVFAQMITLTK